MRSILLAVALVLVMAVPASAATVTLGQRDSNAIVKLRAGDVLELRLKGNSGSTGYHWRTTNGPNRWVLRLVSNRTIESSACTAPTVGCPTTQVIRYRAAHRGRTRFSLAYVPPGGGAPARRFRAEARVGRSRANVSPRPVSPSCLPAGTTSVAVNRRVRVFERASGGTRTLTACDRTNGAKRRLARAEDDGYTTSTTYGDVRLAGGFVAWTSTSTDLSCKADCPPDHDSTRRVIGVFDVAGGTGRGIAADPLDGTLALSERGIAAWAAQPAGGTVEIRASVRAGDDRLLDSGGIDPRSLAIEGTIATWTRDGEERFARLG